MNATDKAYRDFFQHEVPKALPPLPLNRPASVTPPQRSGNQYLMAASVAALLGLGLWLSGTPSRVKPAGDAPGRLLQGAEADGKKLLNGIKNTEMPMP